MALARGRYRRAHLDFAAHPLSAPSLRSRPCPFNPNQIFRLGRQRAHAKAESEIWHDEEQHHPPPSQSQRSQPPPPQQQEQRQRQGQGQPQQQQRPPQARNQSPPPNEVNSRRAHGSNNVDGANAALGKVNRLGNKVAPEAGPTNIAVGPSVEVTAVITSHKTVLASLPVASTTSGSARVPSSIRDIRVSITAGSRS